MPDSHPDCRWLLTQIAALQASLYRAHCDTSAAKILRPRTVHRAVDNDVADVPRTQILRLGRKGQNGIDLSFDELLDGFDGRVGDPADVLGRVGPNMRCHQGHQHVRGRPPVLHADGLAPEVSDSADALLREQFEAADMA